MKQIYEMKRRGHSAQAIARELGLARNTVLKYLNSPDSIVPKPRQPRGSKLDSHTEYIDHRLSVGLENCVVLLRELRSRGYEGSYTVLADYVRQICSVLLCVSLGLGWLTTSCSASKCWKRRPEIWPRQPWRRC